FLRNVSLAARKREPIAAAILDLDRFKHVNDTYGHAMGDEVLRKAASIIGGSLRKSDLLARWGGEEFVALLPNTGADGAANAVRKALDSLAANVFEAPGGRTFHVTFSAGVAEVVADAGMEETVAEADRFLYLAKAQGRNRVVTAKDKGDQQPRSILLVESDD